MDTYSEDGYYMSKYFLGVCLALGSMDEGVSESLPSMQSTSNAGGHADDDERYQDLLQLEASKVVSTKENADLNLMSGCLGHTCVDNKLCNVEMAEHYDLQHKELRQSDSCIL